MKSINFSVVYGLIDNTSETEARNIETSDQLVVIIRNQCIFIYFIYLLIKVQETPF